MPITLDKQLAAIDVLRQENIFVMDSQRARTQNIRPLKILVVNLMPKKANTEGQLLRHLANTPLQLEVEFLYMATAISLKILPTNTWKTTTGPLPTSCLLQPPPLLGGASRALLSLWDRQAASGKEAVRHL